MYHNLNVITVFLNHLRENKEFLERYSSLPIAPVLKSNAYGHGLKLLAKEVNTYLSPFVCVDSLFEAYELQKNGYKKDILIMGYVDPRDIPRKKNIHYAVSDVEYARELINKYKHVKIHLFLDTGMGREWLRLDDCDISWGGLSSLKRNTVGIMSHLASPEQIEISQEQKGMFFEQIKLLRKQGFEPIYSHILASWGLIHSANSEDMYSDMQSLGRSWLAWYGYGHENLKPALRYTTKIVQIKHIKKWDKVGYDGTFTASQDMTIAVLPIGYHDWVDRRLSNIGNMMVEDKLCPILWRISMNITTIDVSHFSASVGQEVVFIDENPASPVSLVRQAERTGIPYDFLVHLSKETRRITVK